MENNEYTKIPKYKNGKYTDEELNKNNYYKRITNNSID